MASFEWKEVACNKLHLHGPAVILGLSLLVPYSGARFSKVPKTLRARKAIRKTPTCLFCKACLFICCKGNKNQNNCKVSCLQAP